MQYSLVVLLISLACASAQITYTYSDFDANALLSWQLNSETPFINPNSNNVLELVSANPSEAGTAFLTNSIPLGNDASFSAAFSFQITNAGGIGDEDGQGADGLTFAINSLTNSFGAGGGGLGYLGMGSSVAVEFDTYDNGRAVDIDGNHVGIDLDGNVASVTSASYPIRMNDGGVHYAWVDYDGVNQILSARIAETNVRPIDPFVQLAVDLVAVLGDTDVFVGFTSGTGAGWGEHDIISFTFVNTYQPIGQITTGVPVATTGAVGTTGAIFGTSCPIFDVDSLAFSLNINADTISFLDFNFIAFGDFNGNTGDIEGRLAVGGDLTLGYGYSIGAAITNLGTDAYTLVVSGQATWGSGALYPANSVAYIGGVFNAPSYLLPQQAPGSGSLSTFFGNAQAAYTIESSILATESDNVAQLVVYGALVLTCNDPSAKQYFATVEASTISSINDWQTVGCNANAEWLINVPDGSDSITFVGNNFPVTGVVYNILGSGRTINVQTSVAGSILSPNNNLDQTGGTIYGKVVVNNVINSLQTNQPSCPTIVSVNSFSGPQ